MRITDLLDKRSIAFDKNPANKQETLDMAVDLMCASGKINDTEAYRKQVYLKEKRKAQQELVKELPFHTEKVIV